MRGLCSGILFFFICVNAYGQYVKNSDTLNVPSGYNVELSLPPPPPLIAQLNESLDSFISAADMTYVRVTESEYDNIEANLDSITSEGISELIYNAATSPYIDNSFSFAQAQNNETSPRYLIGFKCIVHRGPLDLYIRLTSNNAYLNFYTHGSIIENLTGPNIEYHYILKNPTIINNYKIGGAWVTTNFLGGLKWVYDSAYDVYYNTRDAPSSSVNTLTRDKMVAIKFLYSNVKQW